MTAAGLQRGNHVTNRSPSPIAITMLAKVTLAVAGIASAAAFAPTGFSVSSQCGSFLNAQFQIRRREEHAVVVERGMLRGSSVWLWAWAWVLRFSSAFAARFTVVFEAISLLRTWFSSAFSVGWCGISSGVIRACTVTCVHTPLQLAPIFLSF